MFSKDDDEVADLFQETLINIWKGLPSFSGDEGALRGWIYRVALNTCISLDRKKRRRNVVPLTMDISLFDPSSECRVQRADNCIIVSANSINWLKFGIPFIMLWLPGFMYYASRNMGAEEQNGFFCGAVVGAVIGGAIGVYYLINSRRRLNGILNQIEEIKSGM